MPAREPKGAGTPRGERGVILLVLMVGVVIMMILLGRATQTWTTMATREQEEEFIFRARQYVHAINRFQDDQGALPTTMDQLSKPGPKGNSRYVRKPWKDPLTGKDFVLLWLAPDGVSFFRSDGRPSTSGSFRTAPGASGTEASRFNLQELTVPPGSPGFNPEKQESLLDAYKKSLEQKIGARRPFAGNSNVNLDGFDTSSSLMSTPGIGPIAGLATSKTGTSYAEWKGRTSYSGYEVSIFSDRAREPVQAAGAPVRNLFEMPGTPIPGPLTPEGKKLRGTDAESTGLSDALKNQR
ncbi:MAG: type II secretion system protein [Acidobacteriota bacterium]